MQEFELIDQITTGLSSSDAVRLGPGDDAAVVRLAGDLVISTDMLIENVDFRRNWSEPYDIGRKAVAVNVSDIEAMGAKPVGITLALGFPADLGEEWVLELRRGAVEECEKAGVSLVGGDLSSADHITICGTAFGQADQPVQRSGAKPGDVVAVTGKLGWAAAGLITLQRGFRSPLQAIAEQRCPSVPYGQGRVAATAGATAMVDVSDGLLADLGHIADRSGVAIDVTASSLEIPEVAERVAAATGKNPLAFVVAGGEDHALAACFGSNADVPEGWTVIGSVREGTGITLDGKAWEDATGWDHFA